MTNEEFNIDYQRGFIDGFNGAKEQYERPQGEWIITGKEQGAVGMIYTIRKCSKCGWEHSLVIPNNYCPRCGSKMLKVLL